LAGRFYLASRGVPDCLMTLVRGAASEVPWSARTCHRFGFLSRFPGETSAIEGPPASEKESGDKSPHSKAADQTRAAGVGLSPRASGAKGRPAKATDYT
jgi:hypothetical protein